MRRPVLGSIAHLPVQQNTIDGSKSHWVIMMDANMVLQEISFDGFNANFGNSLDDVLTNISNKLERWILANRLTGMKR